MRRTAIALFLLVAGCGGGGGGTGPTAPPPPPPQPTTGLFFDGDGAPGSGTIHLDAASVTAFGTNFVLRVMANDVTDLYGVSFDLDFPGRRLDFLAGASGEGTFLSANGAVETAFEVLRQPAGNLIVGITRLGEVEGVSGTGTLMELAFSIADGAGQGTFRFTDNDAVDSSLDFLDATQWLGASIDVRR